MEAVEAGKPVNLLFGTVISASPLKIQVDQKAIYTEKMLVLTRNVTDYEVDMTVSHQTVVITHGHPVTDTYTGGGTAEDIDHNHPIQGRKKFKVHNALVVGDWVVLARIQKGKKFVVLDWIKPNPALQGESLNSFPIPPLTPPKILKMPLTNTTPVTAPTPIFGKMWRRLWKRPKMPKMRQMRPWKPCPGSSIPLMLFPPKMAP